MTEGTSRTRGTGPPWEEVSRGPHDGLEGPVRTEVLVIGAGLTGLSTARHLRRAGAQVTILDERGPAKGASGRSAGLVLTGTGQHLSRQRIAIGDAATAAVLRLSRENLQVLREIARVEDLGDGIERTGSLRLALSPREVVELERSAILLEEEGIRQRMLSRTEARSLCGGALISGGMYIPDDMVMDPVRVVGGLISALGRDGTSVTHGVRVTSLEEGVEGTVVARTTTHPVRADMVVLATEAFTPTLLPELADRLIPARAQAIAVELGAETPGLLPAVTNFGHEFWRVVGGRLILAGGREASEKTEWILGEEPGERVQAALEKFAAAIFPGLAGKPVPLRWAGVGAFGCDEVPLIGPVAGSRPVLVGAGYGGWGTSLALAAGRRLADLVLEGRCTDLGIFSPRRFQE